MGVSNYLPNNALTQPGVCTSTTRPASPYEGQAIYETDTDVFRFWNGSAWQAIQLPPDIVANTVTGTTSVRANTGHADGGIALRQWTGGAGFTSVATQNMTGNEYMMLSNGTDTFVSGGAGGVTYVRAGNNDSANSVAVSNSGVQLNGVTRLGQSPNPYGWHVANQPVGTEMVIGAWGQSGFGFSTINTWYTLGSVGVTIPNACSVIEMIYGFTIYVSGSGAFQVRMLYSGTGSASAFQYFRNVTFDHFCNSGTIGLSVAPGTGTVSLQIYGQGVTLNGDANDSGYFTVHTV